MVVGMTTTHQPHHRLIIEFLPAGYRARCSCGETGPISTIQPMSAALLEADDWAFQHQAQVEADRPAPPIIDRSEMRAEIARRLSA